MTPRDVPHAVWRAIECVPRPRGPYGECTCGECEDARTDPAEARDSEEPNAELWR